MGNFSVAKTHSISMTSMEDEEESELRRDLEEDEG